MVELERVIEPVDIVELRDLVARHYQYTQSSVARRILDQWEQVLDKFVKVMPIDYKRALDFLAHQQRVEEIKPELIPLPEEI